MLVLFIVHQVTLNKEFVFSSPHQRKVKGYVQAKQIKYIYFLLSIFFFICTDIFSVFFHAEQAEKL